MTLSRNSLDCFHLFIHSLGDNKSSDVFLCIIQQFSCDSEHYLVFNLCAVIISYKYKSHNLSVPHVHSEWGKKALIGQICVLIFWQVVNDAPSRCSIFSQQGNILFMIYMNDKSSESLSADGHTQFNICLAQNN